MYRVAVYHVFLTEGYVFVNADTPDLHHHPTVPGHHWTVHWAAEASAISQHLLRGCVAKLIHLQGKMYKSLDWKRNTKARDVLQPA